jgi:hypothetical protein
MAKKKTTTRKKNRQTKKPMESGTELRVDSEKIQKTGY